MRQPIYQVPPEQGPRVVAIGGGNGLATLLRGLKLYTENITAVVTVADDGGGLPDGFDPNRSDSLGLTIVRSLARDLDGHFAMRNAHPGVICELTL